MARTSLSVARTCEREYVRSTICPSAIRNHSLLYTKSEFQTTVSSQTLLTPRYAGQYAIRITERDEILAAARIQNQLKYHIPNAPTKIHPHHPLGIPRFPEAPSLTRHHIFVGAMNFPTGTLICLPSHDGALMPAITCNPPGIDKRVDGWFVKYLENDRYTWVPHANASLYHPDFFELILVASAHPSYQRQHRALSIANDLYQAVVCTNHAKRELETALEHDRDQSAAEIGCKAVTQGESGFKPLKKKRKYTKPVPWSSEEIALLDNLVTRNHGTPDWDLIALHFERRSKTDVSARWRCIQDPALRKGPWSRDDDRELLRGVRQLRNWTDIGASLHRGGAVTGYRFRSRYMEGIAKIGRLPDTITDEEIERLLTQEHGVPLEVIQVSGNRVKEEAAADNGAGAAGAAV